MSDISDMQVRFPNANEGRSINKFGVPYHSYTLRLANGDEVRMDVGYEEDWVMCNNVCQMIVTIASSLLAGGMMWMVI